MQRYKIIKLAKFTLYFSKSFFNIDFLIQTMKILNTISEIYEYTKIVMTLNLNYVR